MNPLQQAKRVVIKLGTGVLTSGIGDLDTQRIETLCAQVNTLRSRGIEVILVSSGAVGLGMGKLELKQRPKDLALLQACAAMGNSEYRNCVVFHSLSKRSNLPGLRSGFIVGGPKTMREVRPDCQLSLMRCLSTIE